MRSIRLSLLLASAALAAHVSAQLTVDPMVPASICGGPTLNIPFTAGSTFNSGNTFSVELSDAAGSFAAPSVIGSATATGSGSISCAFPEGIVGGSGQAIRVVATDPVEIGDAYVLPITTVVPPNAGSSAVVTLCSNSVPQNLLTFLVGSPSSGGEWTGPLGPMNGVFIPGIDPPGPYTYFVPGIAPCGGASAIVYVTVNMAANAGTGGLMEVCSDAAPFIMFSLLGGAPQPGGFWTSPDGNPMNGVYVPGVSTPGCFTYTVAGMAPCQSESVALCISEVPALSAGSTTSVSVCSTGGVLDLFDALGGDPSAGGTWTGPLGPMSGSFVPSVHPSGPYLYVLSGSPVCTGDSAIVHVTVNQAANAGTGAAVEVCAGIGSLMLFSFLGGTPQPGGTWTDVNGDPIPGFSLPGCFTYTVTGIAPCASDTAVVCISEVPALSAGSSTSVNWCASWGYLDLFDALGGDPSPGGNWVDVNATGQLNGGFWDPTGVPSGSYQFTYTVGGGACPVSVATVTVVQTGICVYPPQTPDPVE